jgi:uncharacterized SAM-dependent methyltransferase
MKKIYNFAYKAFVLLTGIFCSMNTLLQASDPKIENDFLDLLTHTKEAHVSKYMYHSKEDYFGKLISENSGYYILREEKELINNFLDIAHFFNGINCKVIEFGPGDAEAIISKTIPILQQIPHLSSYHAIDIRKAYATGASLTILKTFPLTIVSHRVGDFFKKLDTHKAHLILFLGGTIHNFTPQELDSLFESFNRHLNKGGYVLITVDTNHDPKTLQRAYDHPYSHALALSCMPYFKKMLSLSSFDDEAFQCIYEWHPETSEVKLFLQSLKPQSFHVGNQLVNVKMNEKFHVFSSRKFKDNDIMELASNHHFEIKTFFCLHPARIKMYLLQKKKTDRLRKSA